MIYMLECRRTGVRERKYPWVNVYEETRISILDKAHNACEVEIDDII